MLNLKSKNATDLAFVHDSIKENDVKRKLVELDLTKRILKIELQQDKLQKNISSLDNLENLNELASNAKEIKSKLRAIEDLKFLERLEVVETQENINTLTDSFTEIKGKVDIITEAIKNLNDLKIPGNKNTVTVEEILSKITPRMDWFENKLNELSSKKMDNHKLDDFKKNIENLKQDISDISKQTDGTFSLLKSGLDTQSQMLKQSLKHMDSFDDLKSQAESWIKFTNIQRKVNDKFDDILEKINLKIKKNTEEFDETIKHVKEFNSSLKKHKLDNIGKILDKIDSIDTIVDAKFEECLKPAIDEELKDVVENVHTLLNEVNEINSNIELKKEDDTARITTAILNLKKDSIKKISVLEENLNSLTNRMSDIENVQDKEYPTLVEVKELAEKLAKLETTANNESFLEKDFDEYRKAFESKLSVLENRIDSFKDNNKEMESLVSLKTQEVSKNTFEKIGKDLKPLVERINELTDDVDVIKELRSEILDDVKHVLDIQKEKEKNDVKNIASQLNAFKSEMKQIDLKERKVYSEKLNEKLGIFDAHINKLRVMTESFSENISAEVNKKITNVEKENEILRNELNQLKDAYFQMIQLQQQAPVIIE